MRRPRLIPQWRRAWRWLSMHVATVAIGWGVLPPDWQVVVLSVAHVPEGRMPLVLGLLMVAARLVDQEGGRG